MTIRHILPALAILVSFSSCSQKPFLLSANTGSYASLGKPEKTVVNLPESNLEASAEENISTATSEENQQVITYPAAAYQERKQSILSVKPVPAPENPAFEQPGKSVTNQKKASFNNRKASVQKNNKDDSPEKPGSKFNSNLFSILSFACALTSLLLVLSGIPVGLYLGLPAIVFGIIGLSKKEEFKSFATVGLIIGILEVVLVVIILATLRPGK